MGPLLTVSVFGGGFIILIGKTDLKTTETRIMRPPLEFKPIIMEKPVSNPHKIGLEKSSDWYNP